MSRSMSWKGAFALLLAVGLLSGEGSPAKPIRRASLTLRLNVPAFRLDLLEGSTVIATYSVAVGERRYPTPLGDFQVTHITWNPWWYPPSSEWARKDTVHPPGSNNPMGGVKLHVGGLYFLHGTPFENSIGKPASHGCVRMRNADARALARALNRLGGGGLSEEVLDEIEADSSRTVTVALQEPVPIDVVYVTVEVAATRLYLHRDIYGRARPSEARALETLADAGFDTATVDRPSLKRLLRRARSRSTSIAVDSLILPLAAAVRPPARELTAQRR